MAQSECAPILSFMQLSSSQKFCFWSLVLLLKICILFILDVKSNELGPTQFKASMTVGGLCNVELPQYPLIGLQYPEEGEEYIYYAYIKTHLSFSFYSGLKEMRRCHYFSFVHVAPNALRMWVGFRILCAFPEQEYSLNLF